MIMQFRKIDARTLHHLPPSALHPADTYFHFSFANYYDPSRIHFGALRVLNDDTVQPRSGFDRHPHQDMEIVSYIISGHLTHWDSATGSEEVIGRGDVQAITAGTGVWHSEHNRHDDPCHLLQIWILPPARELPVSYASHHFEPEQRHNQLLQVVTNRSNPDRAPLQLQQDVNIYVAEITAIDARLTFRVETGRQAYLANTEGQLGITGVGILKARDAVEIVGPAELEFTLAGAPCHFLLLEMANPSLAN